MATKAKIKITDDPALRARLDAEYAQTSQTDLCRYALLLARHILTAVHIDPTDSAVLQAGFAVNESWQAGKARMHDVRQAAFQIHQVAKGCPNSAARAAWRTAGHAVATGHMPEHAMVASDYAVLTINILQNKDPHAAAQERAWQIRCLKAVQSTAAL